VLSVVEGVVEGVEGEVLLLAGGVLISGVLGVLVPVPEPLSIWVESVPPIPWLVLEVEEQEEVKAMNPIASAAIALAELFSKFFLVSLIIVGLG
jgi:hypothetical protein